jgi:hypothetical protein
VVVARGRPNHRKRAVVLVSGVGVGWCWPEEGPTPKNECDCSFSGGVGGDGGQRKVQPSFSEWCWQEEDLTLKNE